MMVNLRPLLIVYMGLIRYAKFYFIFIDELVGMQSDISAYCTYITEL